jgi:ribonuclease VapC
VLDASALLALLRGEPGSERVASLVGDAAMSVANVAEVAAKLVDLGLDGDLSVDRIVALGVRCHEVTLADARRQAGFRTLDGGARLSLGDRLCLALAARLELPAVTADRLWADLALPVGVDLVR